MKESLEELKKHYEEVKKYGEKITSIPTIEERDSDYIYLMHHTSLTEEDVNDIYLNGLAYEANDISRTFNNLSQDWISKSWAKERADLTSMEKVIVEKCKRGDFHCFLYKIPRVFFEPVNNEFYPIPIWNIDKNYVYKKNISSSGVKYDISNQDRTFYRLHPKLLLGHYDLKENKFYQNSEYSPIINNSKGVFDNYQIIKLPVEYEDFWRHNEFILKKENSPFEKALQEIEENYSLREKNKSSFR